MSIHLMDKKELETAPVGTVVWMELREYDDVYVEFRRVQPLVMYNGVYGNYYSIVRLTEMDNNSRFWSHRPTIQTMDETPWEEE